jgi:hypothetical protein
MAVLFVPLWCIIKHKDTENTENKTNANNFRKLIQSLF